MNSTPAMQTLGQELRRLRKAAKITQEQLASRLSVSVRTVRRYETDDAVPTQKRIGHLLGVLGLNDPLRRSEMEKVAELWALRKLMRKLQHQTF